MLKALVPSLIASGLAALVGTGVGGWITSDIVTQDTQIKMVVNSYGSYLSEATRALTLVEKDEFTNKDKIRLDRATAALDLTASRQVLRWAIAFAEAIKLPEPQAREHNINRFGVYNKLVSEMRKNLKGKGAPKPDSECKEIMGHRYTE